MGRAVLVSALLLGLSATGAPAKDLGVMGATFPVIERDLLAVLGEKLRAAERSGKLQDLNRKFVARVKAKLERPPPVPGITRVERARSWLFDPSITVPRDFADQHGRVFARQGERINPLDRLPSFNRVLVFVDGDDAEQVAFALRRAKRAPDRERVYIVLTSGAPLELMRRHKVEIFFDQDASLTTRFGITRVPSVVEREGRSLRISEVRP